MQHQPWRSQPLFLVAVTASGNWHLVQSPVLLRYAVEVVIHMLLWYHNCYMQELMSGEARVIALISSNGLRRKWCTLYLLCVPSHIGDILWPSIPYLHIYK